MTIVARTVSLSHDNSTWVDVSASVTGQVTWNRGLSSTLGDWLPGTASFTITATDRAYDPLNDAATFQPHQGDYVKILLAGGDAFRGRINQITPSYTVTGPAVLSSLAITVADAVADLAAGLTGTSTTTQPYKAGTWVDSVINDPTTPWFSGTTSIAAGDVSTTSVEGGIPVIEIVQNLTKTEGGATQLFASKAGVLTWRGRYSKPSTTVAFGSGGIKIAGFGPSQDQQWANRVNITPIEHIDTQASSSSVTNGTGTKTFTLTTPPPVGDTWGFSAGASVVVSSASSANTMTGTVTSFNEATRVLVCNITSATGSSTRTDWVFDFVEPSEMQYATDAASNTLYGTWRAKDFSGTYHRTRPAAAAEAIIRTAEMAHPSKRIEWIDIDLAACSSSETTTVLGLEIGDAAKVTLAFASGTPATFVEYRYIVGIRHTQSGMSHTVRLILGRVPTYDFTATLKQNGSTVAATTTEAIYTIQDGWCDASLVLSVTGTGTANTEIKVTPSSLPAPLQTNHTAHGTFFLYGGATAHGTCYFDGTDIKFYVDASTTPLGQTPNMTLGAGYTLALTLSYPVVAQSTFTAVLEQAGVTKSASATGYYKKRDGWCRAVVVITANAAGTAGNAILGTPTGLPSPLYSSTDCQGWATYTVASSSTRYPLAARFDTVNFRMTTDNRNGLIGVAPSLAIASGDTLCITLEYPVAS